MSDETTSGGETSSPAPSGESVVERLLREQQERSELQARRLRENREKAASRELFSDEDMTKLVESAMDASTTNIIEVSTDGDLVDSPREQDETPAIEEDLPPTVDPDEVVEDDGPDVDFIDDDELIPADDEPYEEDDDSISTGDDEEHPEAEDDDGSDDSDDEDHDDLLDDFENWDDNPFVAQEVAADVAVDPEDLEEEPEDLDGLAQEQREIHEAEDEAEYERRVKILEASSKEHAHLDDLLSETIYPSRNPRPMPADRVELHDDRPEVAPVEVVKATPAEPLRYSSTTTTVKLPKELIDYIRAVVVETLQSTVTRLDQKQLNYLKGRIGSERFATMSDAHRVDEWIVQTGQEFAANRLVTVFVASNANIDVEGLDATSKLVVDALRRADPTLREMHSISAKLDAMHASHEKTRSLSAYNNQTLRALEYAVSFIIAYFIPGGYVNLRGVTPSAINVVTKESKTVRDRLLGQTKKEIVNLQFSEGRPRG